MRLVRATLIAVALTGFSSQSFAQNPQCMPAAARDSVIAFIGVNVVSLQRDAVLLDRVVIVRNGRIAEIKKRTDANIPRRAMRIDGRGKWLMPGLVDSHVHTIGPPAISRRLFLLGLTQGITTAIVLSGDTTSLQLRDRFKSEADLGPTLFVAGPLVDDSMLTHSGGVRVADTYKRTGYDLIKVYNRLSRDGYRGVMSRARELDIPVVGHVVRSMDVEGVLGARQRGIVHMEEYLYTYFGLKTTDTTHIAANMLDTAAIPYLAAITASAGTYVTPTLVTYENMLGLIDNFERVLAQPGMKYVGKPLADALRRHGKSAYADKFTHANQIQTLRDALAFQRKMTRAFHHAGVPLLAGTDAPIAVTMPGSALHEELQNLREAMSPFDVLRTATQNAADYIGQPREFGTVEVGKRADLLLLDANPLTDVSNAQRIVGVMTRGRWLDRTAIAATLACLERTGAE